MVVLGGAAAAAAIATPPPVLHPRYIDAFSLHKADLDEVPLLLAADHRARRYQLQELSKPTPVTAHQQPIGYL